MTKEESTNEFGKLLDSGGKGRISIKVDGSNLKLCPHESVIESKYKVNDIVILGCKISSDSGSNKVCTIVVEIVLSDANESVLTW